MTGYTAKLAAFFISSLLLLITVAALAQIIIIPNPVSADPIVIVPGIGASWNWDVMMGKAFGDNWDFLIGAHEYDALIQALKDAGLEEGRDFAVVFYDWRKSSADTAFDYLKPVIDRLKAAAGKDRVDIVAHSLGGLVAREYIQSDNYDNDVDQLITLGTPHYGSSDVYTLWEGGKIPDNWSGLQKRLIWFYIKFLKFLTVDTSSNYEVIHDSVPSVGELMPVYDFLLKDSVLIPSQDITARNLFLEVLNLPQNQAKLLARIRLTAVAGTDQPTVGVIPVTDRDESDAPRWADGKPSPMPPERNNQQGDNRVLTDSALMGGEPVLVYQKKKPATPQTFRAAAADWLRKRLARLALAQIGPPPSPPASLTITSAHARLPETAIPEIFDALGLAQPASITPAPTVSASFNVWVASPVTVAIANPAGKVINAYDQSSIAGAEYDAPPGTAKPQAFYIPNPVPGDYTLTLTGLETGAAAAGGGLKNRHHPAGVFHLAAAAFNNFGQSVKTLKGVIRPKEIRRFAVGVNETGLISSELKETTPSLASLRQIIKQGRAAGLIQKGLARFLLSHLDLLEHFKGRSLMNRRLVTGVFNRFRGLISNHPLLIDPGLAKKLLEDAAIVEQNLLARIEK